MSLWCRLTGHTWGDWYSPVYALQQDGLETNVTHGSQRKCKRCSEWDVSMEVGQ